MLLVYIPQRLGKPIIMALTNNLCLSLPFSYNTSYSFSKNLANFQCYCILANNIELSLFDLSQPRYGQVGTQTIILNVLYYIHLKDGLLKSFPYSIEIHRNRKVYATKACFVIYLFIYLFIQYFKRVTYLAQRPVYHMAL